MSPKIPCRVSVLRLVPDKNIEELRRILRLPSLLLTDERAEPFLRGIIKERIRFSYQKRVNIRQVFWGEAILTGFDINPRYQDPEVTFYWDNFVNELTGRPVFIEERNLQHRMILSSLTVRRPLTREDRQEVIRLATTAKEEGMGLHILKMRGYITGEPQGMIRDISKDYITLLTDDGTERAVFINNIYPEDIRLYTPTITPLSTEYGIVHTLLGQALLEGTPVAFELRPEIAMDTKKFTKAYVTEVGRFINGKVFVGLNLSEKSSQDPHTELIIPLYHIDPDTFIFDPSGQ